MRLNLLKVLSDLIDAASLSPHTWLFSGSGGHLLLSLSCFHIFFLLLAIPLLTMKSAVMKIWTMKNYCCGPQVLTLLSDTEFPFSIMLLLLNVAEFWPRLQDPLWPRAPARCISMKCLSLLYVTAYQPMIYHLIIFLLVKSTANTSDLLGFYLWFFLFLLPYSFLPSQKWSGLAHHVFLFFDSFPSSAVFFWVVPICSFFFWWFCPATVLIM